jgi:predicted phage gp36 major capsid-like protein
MNTTTSKLASLLGSASFLTIANALAGHAQQVAQPPIPAAQQVPERVLITGSPMHGTPAPSAPLTDPSKTDIAANPAVSAADWFKTVPGLNVVRPEGQKFAQAQIERTLVAQAQAAPTQVAQAQVAQAQMAQAAPQETVPEQVLITGSLIAARSPWACP